jgi:N-acetylglucosaminyl-diphospho-decaprenol L-rhamnosyltransferase
VSGPFQGGGGPARVAVVVVSFEAREPLLATLDGLAAVKTPLEVAVVDNASRDGSADAVRGRHPRALVLANADNLGFARACNQGLRATGAPLVLFLNPDAEVRPGAVEALAGLLEARPEVGAVGPRTRFADGAIQVSTGPDLTLRTEGAQRRLVRGVARRDARALARAEALHSREHEPAWVSGACLMVRRAAADAVGGFDERFFLYEEDADLCRRLRARGWRVVFTPAAEVCHRLGASMARAPRRSRLEYHRSHLLYYRKHNGPIERALLRLLLGGRGLLAWARGAALGGPEARSDAAALVRLALSGRA